jgi:flagellar assembly protein FliH
MIDHETVPLQPSTTAAENGTMTLKVIKQGSDKFTTVRKYSFSMIRHDRQQPEEQSIIPEQPSIPDPPGKEYLPEASEPAIPLSELALHEKAAFDNGFTQGMKAGEDAAAKKMEAMLQRYSETIAEIKGLKKSLYSQAEHEVVLLAVEVAKKIVYREIRVDQDIIRTLVRVALGHVTEKTAVTIHLNPVDYNYMMKTHADLSETEGREIALSADNSIQQGGCVIHTDCGEVDARIDEKFREVEHAFFDGTSRHGKS